MAQTNGKDSPPLAGPLSAETKRPSVEIKKSPLLERKKMPGYQMTEEEKEVTSNVTTLQKELERTVLTTEAPQKKTSAPEIHFELHTEDGQKQRFLHVHDPHATVHSDLSDLEHSDVEDDYEPHPEANRKMSMTEKAQLENMMREADFHHESTEDVELLHEWAFWIDKNVKKGVSEESFLESLHKLGSFKTSHKFSELLLTYSDELINIHQHSEKCNIRLFREGVTPTREDPKNINGGQYVVFLPKDRTEVKRLWLEFMIAAIGEKFQLKGETTGIVLALKRRADTIAIWTDRGCHPSHYTQQKEHICEVLGMPPNTKIKYNNHHQNPNKKHVLMKGPSWAPGSGQHSPLSSPVMQRHVSYQGPSSPVMNRHVSYGGPAPPSPTTKKASDLSDEWRRSPAKVMDAGAWENARSPQTHRRSNPDVSADSGRSPRTQRRSNPDKYDDFANQYGPRSPNMNQRQGRSGQLQPDSYSRSPSMGNDNRGRWSNNPRQLSEPGDTYYSPSRGYQGNRNQQGRSPARKPDSNANN